MFASFHFVSLHGSLSFLFLFEGLRFWYNSNSFVLTDRGYKSPGEKNIDADLLPVDEYTVLYSHDCSGTLSKSMFEKARLTTFLI